MERKLCSIPSKLHFWKVGTNIMQAIQNCKERWKGLHAIAKHTTTMKLNNKK
jgi:hypothetical protein